MLSITHTYQFTTISTVEQLELLPKLITEALYVCVCVCVCGKQVWEHFGL